MRALKEHGYRIPEDVSLIGFDNTSVCELVQPSLSSIHVPKHELGRLAVRRLEARLRDEARDCVKLAVCVRLQMRESVAASRHQDS